jgi:phosphoglycolate phosphatase-like HAD superfamily hydrolase
MNTNRVFIFDFDGTLVDSLQSTFAVINRVVGKFGLNKIDISNIEHFKKVGVRGLIKELKVSWYKMPFLVGDYRKEFALEIPKLGLVKGMAETLSGLRVKQIKMGILTSNSEENVRQFLTNNQIDLFDFIYGGSSLFGKDKVLKQLIKDRHLNLDSVVYVGDEVRDIEAAKKCGVNAAAVCWGFSNREILLDSHPDWLLEKPSELLEI